MLKEYMKQLGYKDSEIELIRNSYPIHTLKETTIFRTTKSNFSYLLELGYESNEIIKMTCKVPQILTMKKEVLEKKIKDIQSIGYKANEIKKMLKKFPTMLVLNVDHLKQKMKDMETFGYKEEDLIIIVKKFPQFFSFNFENKQQKIEDLIGFGFTRAEVIHITKQLPQIFGLSIENMEQKMTAIMKLGYTKEETLKMFVQLPMLYSLDVNTTIKKIEYLKKIGLSEIILKDTKQLMQSLELTHARYEFLKQKNVIIDNKNYRKLFCYSKRFEKQYHITKEELLEKYQHQNMKVKV